MGSKRAQITGILPEIKQYVKDFDEADQIDLVLRTHRIADQMLELARLIALMSVASNTLKSGVLNPNLFGLASMHYGDVRVWEDLMNASYLTTPVIDGDVDVILPKVLGNSVRG